MYVNNVKKKELNKPTTTTTYMTTNFYQGLISYNWQIIIDYEKNRVLSSLRPKLGISYGIGRKYRYWSRNFSFRNFFFSNSTSWGNTSYYKLENKPSTSKKIESI